MISKEEMLCPQCGQMHPKFESIVVELAETTERVRWLLSKYVLENGYGHFTFPDGDTWLIGDDTKTVIDIDSDSSEEPYYTAWDMDSPSVREVGISLGLVDEEGNMK